MASSRRRAVTDPELFAVSLGEKELAACGRQVPETL